MAFGFGGPGGVGTRRDPHVLPRALDVRIPVRPHPTRARGAAGPPPDPRDPRLVTPSGLRAHFLGKAGGATSWR